MSRTWDITGIRTVEQIEQAVTIATVHELEYHAEWMSDEYVSVTVASPEPVDFHFGDTLTYRGEAFRITYDPNIIKKAALHKYGEGFTYENIKLYSDASKMKSIDFKDVVLEDNYLPYTSLSKFSFYAESVEDLADRLQANLNRETTGWRVLTPNLQRCWQREIDTSDWNDYYTTSATLGEHDVNIDITETEKCWETLKFVYEKFGLQYFVTGKTVVIGADSVKADHIFRYGKNNGLYEIERTSDENQEVVTKLFAYGSENNLPLNYYANLGKKMFTVGTRDTVGTVATGYSYGIKTTIPYASIASAMTGVSVTLEYNNLSIRANCDSHMINGVKCVWWYFRFYQPGDTTPEQFYNALGEGEKTVYVTSGANINAWPTQYIEIPQTYDYPALLSINRLMLPGFPDKSLDQWVWDKRNSYEEGTPEYEQWSTIYGKYTFSTDEHDPWIASKNLTEIGIKEGIVNYDGSQQKEIKPTIEGTGYDEVMWTDLIEDNGYIGEDAAASAYTFSFMPMGDADAIDWNDNDGSLAISMKDGACVGREFKVKDVGKNGNGDWVLTLERQKDESIGRYFPYKESTMLASYYQVMGRGNWQGTRDGDHFIATGLFLQKTFVDIASEKMFIAACGYLDRRDHMRYTYLPKVDEIYMQRQDDYIKSGATDKPLIYGTASYHDTLHAGMQMEFEDSDLGIWHTPYIDQLTIKENGNNGLPTYDVVLRDEKEKGTLEKLTDQIADLQHPVIAPTERQTRPSRTVDYDEWVEGHAYYYQTLNPEPDENGVIYIETSYVWHRGKKWMCKRTLTTEEPQLGAADWVVVEGDTTFAIKFYDSDTDGYPYGEYVTARRGHVNIPVWPIVLWGTDDVTYKVSAWNWDKTTQLGGEVTSWQTTRNITITDAVLPPAWSATNPAIFTCTATIPGVDTSLTNTITI